MRNFARGLRACLDLWLACKPYCVNSRLPGPFIRRFWFSSAIFALTLLKPKTLAAALFPVSTPFYVATFQRRFPRRGAASQNDPFAQTRQPRARTLYFYSRINQPSITQWTNSDNMACSQCIAAHPRSRKTRRTPFFGVLTSLLIHFRILFEIEDDTPKLAELYLLVPKEQGVGRTQCFVSIILSLKRHS